MQVDNREVFLYTKVIKQKGFEQLFVFVQKRTQFKLSLKANLTFSHKG